MRKPVSSAFTIITLGFFLFWVNGDNYAASLLLIRISEDFGVSLPRAAATVVSYMLFFGLFTVVFGPLGDRFGKGRILMIAAAGSAAGSVLSAFAASLPVLVVVRAINGAFSAGVMPVAMAYVGEISAQEDRQRNIGKVMGLMFLGGALATLFGGSLAHFGSWRLVYLVYGAAEAVLLVPLLFLLPLKAAGRAASGFLAPYREALGTPGFLKTASLLFFVGFAVLGTFFYLGKFLADRTGFGLIWIGSILSVYGLGTLMGGRNAGRLKSKARHGFFLIAGVIGGAGYAGFGLWGSSLIAAVPALFLIGFGFVALQSSIVTALQDLTPARRGAAMSLASFCMVTSGALGTYVNGRIFMADGRLLLLLAAAAFVAAGILAAAYFRFAGQRVSLL